MKSLILAGGSGTRLRPLTAATNKPLLPVYDRPMISWACRTIALSGITETLVVTGGKYPEDFKRLLGDGSDWGLKIEYAHQSSPAGIADAMKYGRDFAGNDSVCVILADNIFQYPIDVTKFDGGATIFLHESVDPRSYGVVELDCHFNVINIEEKPKIPRSNYVATGIYLYDNTVWDYIDELRPSARGEYEITDLNKLFLMNGRLKAEILNGLWFDAGASIDQYNDVCTAIRQQFGE